jgi:hypothetical protein
VQTFLPYPDFVRSAQALDQKLIFGDLPDDLPYVWPPSDRPARCRG